MNKEMTLSDVVEFFGKLNEEKWHYKMALLDIKEYIEKHNIISVNKEYLPNEVEKIVNIELLEIVNKAIGDKENE